MFKSIPTITVSYTITHGASHTVSQQSHTTLKTYNVPHSWAETHPFLTKT